MPAAAALPLAAKIGIGVGGALLSSHSSKTPSSPAADLQARIASQLFNQTDPLRQGLIGRSTDFINGGGIDNSPTYSALKAQAEPLYNQARENIISSTPAGGGLTAALAGLEGDRARALTEARGTVNESELARAMALATGSTGATMSGLGSAGSIQAALAEAQANRESGMLGALGTGVGAYLGSK